MASDKILNEQIKAQIEALRKLLDPSNEQINKIIQQALWQNEQILESGMNWEAASINDTIDAQNDICDALLTNINRNFASFSVVAMNQAYWAGHNFTTAILDKYLQENPKQILDTKAIGALVQDASDDFTAGINGGRKVIGSFFKFSKNGVLTEREINSLFAQTLVTDGTPQGLQRALQNKFKEVLGEDQKYIQIINKNGDPMNWKISSYSEVVARTRAAEAQIAGAIEVSEANGISTFRVTAHNTTTAICKPHENKIYTTDQKLYDLFEPLNSENKPVYHPNCQHRLLPAPFTKNQLAGMREAA